MFTCSTASVEDPSSGSAHTFKAGHAFLRILNALLVSRAGHPPLPAAIIWGSSWGHWLRLSTPPASTTELRASWWAGALWWPSAGSPRRSSHSAKGKEGWWETMRVNWGRLQGKNYCLFKNQPQRSASSHRAQRWSCSCAHRCLPAGRGAPGDGGPASSCPDGGSASSSPEPGWLNKRPRLLERPVPCLLVKRLGRQGLSASAQPLPHTAHPWRGQTQGQVWFFQS